MIRLRNPGWAKRLRPVPSGPPYSHGGFGQALGLPGLDEAPFEGFQDTLGHEVAEEATDGHGVAGPDERGGCLGVDDLHRVTSPFGVVAG